MTAPLAPAADAAPPAPVDPGVAGAAPAAPAAPPSIADALDAFRAGEPAPGTEQPHHSTTQPRDEAGKFDAAGNPVEPEAGAPPEGAEGEVGGPPPESLRVPLPAREEGDPDVEIEVDDPAVAERLRQLRNGYQRGEQLRIERAEVAAERAKNEEFAEMVRTDPIGFVQQALPMEVQIEVALQVLANPDAFEAARERVEQLMDPEQVETARARLETRRYQVQEQLRTEYATRQQNRQQAEAVRESLRSITPEDWDHERAQTFLRDCMNDLSQLVRRMGMRAIEPAHIPVALAARLRSVGIDPVTAAETLTRRPATPGAPAPTAASRPPAPQRPATVKARPVATGAALVAGEDRRRQASAGAPAGTVVPASGGNPLPPNARLEDVFAHLRKQAKQQ